jgi:starvation-inducible DNA-binding protein
LASARRQSAWLPLIGKLDPVSRDVLLDVLRKLEEQLWLMRAQLSD